MDLLKTTLIKAIRLFNSGNKEFNIIEETYSYKIRLSKKSGLPDTDLPSLNENLTLSEVNHLNFSIIIEEKHVVIAPKKKFNDNFDAMSMKSIRTNAAKNQNYKDENEPLIGNHKSNGFFSCFKCCFNRKKG